MTSRDKGNKNERGATYTDTNQLLFVMYKNVCKIARIGEQK